MGMQGGYITFALGMYLSMAGIELSPEDIGLAQQCASKSAEGLTLMSASIMQLYGRFRAGPRTKP